MKVGKSDSILVIYFKADHPYGVLLPGWLVLSLSPEIGLAPTAAVEDCCLLSSSSKVSQRSRTAWKKSTKFLSSFRSQN